MTPVPNQAATDEPRAILRESSPSSEVETELFIGPPETRLRLVSYFPS